MQNEEILARVRAFCQEQELLSGASVAAAVSGGADSMALLRILLALQPEFGYALTACHVNHGLRGAAADRDEAFVRAECARLGVEVRVFRAAELGEVPAHAGEDWARRLRYACFDRLRAQEGISLVATAHTGTDQAETLLLRLARGTGLHGAAGIRPKRDFYVRPLLCLTRADTESYCTALGQGWVTDETNDADDYARNRVRHAALPALASTNAAAERNLARFCEKAAQADAYLERQAQSLLNAARVTETELLPAAAHRALAAGQGAWDLEALRAADPLVLKTALHGLVSPVRDAEETYIRLLADLVQRGSGAVQLTAEVRFCARGGCLWRETLPGDTGPVVPLCVPFRPQNGQVLALPGGRKLEIGLTPAFFEEKTRDVHKKDLKNRADYAKITTLYPALMLRFRQPGDRFRPAGSGVSRELRKWMNEVGIPPAERASWPVLAYGSEVVWVCGAGFAQGLAPDEASAQILRLEVK